VAAADASAAEAARKALVQRIRTEARRISSKYVVPPHTTDFAVMFLPTEGLYAEIAQQVDVLDSSQREHRVGIAGPSTFSALLNALQMGFRTLAIEKRSGEVWKLLGTVKSDFGAFAELLDKTRLRLRQGRHSLNAIYFSATPESASIQPGDVVDVAFNPQINSFRGDDSVQLNILDIRPSCAAPCGAEMDGYTALRAGTLTAQGASDLLPDRATLALVWRYLASCGSQMVKESPMCLCRKIVRWSGTALNLEQLLTCLDIFSDVGLLQTQRLHKYISIQLTPRAEKADLGASATMQTLLHLKES
jgi:hypothetical protein